MFYLSQMSHSTCIDDSKDWLIVITEKYHKTIEKFRSSKQRKQNVKLKFFFLYSRYCLYTYTLKNVGVVTEKSLVYIYSTFFRFYLFTVKHELNLLLYSDVGLN